MCTSKLPVFENEEDQAKKVRLIGNEKFCWLILWCIEEDPAMRPSMEEVIKYLEWLKDIDSELYK